MVNDLHRFKDFIRHKKRLKRMLRNSGCSRTRTIFVRFALPYTAILVIFLIMSVVAYMKTYAIVKKDTITSGLTELAKSRDVLEMKLKEVESLVSQIALSEGINEYAKVMRPMENRDYYKIQTTCADLPAYKLTNKFINGIYIYFFNSSSIVSNISASARVEYYYKAFLNYADRTYPQWISDLTNHSYYRSYWPAQAMNRIDAPGRYITYLQSINAGSSNQAIIMVLIDENQIRSFINDIDVSKEGLVFISDHSGDMITCSNQGDQDLLSFQVKSNGITGYHEEEINGVSMNILHVTSAYNGWNYYAMIPAHVFMEKVQYVRDIFLSIFGAALMIGIAISAVFAYKNSKPVRKLIDIIKKEADFDANTGYNDYKLIENTIENLIHNNTRLKKEMDEQLALWRFGFFDRLLQGGFFRRKDFEITLSHINYAIKGDAYVVVLIHISGSGGEISSEILRQAEKNHVIVADYLKTHVGWSHYIHNTDYDKITMIIARDKEEEKRFQDDLNTLLNDTIDELDKFYNISVSCGVGLACTQLLNISQSYREAEKVLSYHGYENCRIVWFSHHSGIKPDFYYPLDIEVKLINMTKISDKSEVRSILNDIIDKNFKERFLSDIDTKQLFFEIRGTILKIRNEVQDVDTESIMETEYLINQLDFTKPFQQIFDDLEALLFHFCDLSDKRKKSHNIRLRNKVIKYISDHYMESSLSLCSTATHFSLNEQYLSKFFKEQLGENFSAYVESIRMKEALRLLEYKAFTINEISNKVGYNSSNTFYRAFKKIYGEGPKTFKRDRMKSNYFP